MSSSFSANQYDSAFKSKRLQNWCEAKSFKERPSKHVGHTSFVADSRGHLLPGVKKGTAWPDFKGTWDLPSRIPAHHINKTARSAEGLIRLESWGFGQPKKCKSLSDRGSRITDVGEQTSGDVHQYVADPSTGAEAQPESQISPITGHESYILKRHEAGSPAEQSIQAIKKDKPVCATEENPSLTVTAGNKNHNRPETRGGKPQSNMSQKAAMSSFRQTHRDNQQEQ
ncbi:hypothetical protein CHARACLAT_004485 [Characodon lateralis]|uniref:Protein Flattop n=1 Tax=Characodon lateralis TaxID=208331 RepID=A0ABU7F0I5_9TELE|nr:hypothetical protein [Characodon lateralis]